MTYKFISDAIYALLTKDIELVHMAKDMNSLHDKGKAYQDIKTELTGMGVAEISISKAYKIMQKKEMLESLTLFGLGTVFLIIYWNILPIEFESLWIVGFSIKTAFLLMGIYTFFQGVSNLDHLNKIRKENKKAN